MDSRVPHGTHTRRPRVATLGCRPCRIDPSAALRAARLHIVGSGQGSVGTRDILAELPALAQQITRGAFNVAARSVPLADVDRAWAEAARSPERIVLTPQR
jgi:hypothetical protein